MKLNKLALVAAIACGLNAGNLFGAQGNDIQLVSHAVASCDCGEPVCGCESVDPSCDSGCDVGCDSGCDSLCGSGLSLGLVDKLKCCELGEQWSLFGEHCGIEVGGWAQLGYHNRANTLFNSRPDNYQLHQAWIYAEKAIDTSCGFDIGGRIDYLYGTDGPDTQAFGIGNDHWDNGWDNGGDYGHAIPQLYVEAGYGDLSVKVGHFFTLIGYEVVAATGNFFYSHAYTMYNSEPFTHTGALATYSVSDDVTVYGGYVMGWDSGFEDNGDSFLGGISAGVTDNVTLTYATVGGTFRNNADNGGTLEKGYMHSLIANYAVTDSLNYIIQSDVLDTDNGAGATVRDTFGINQYLLYNVSDCLAVGSRFEWYQSEGVYTNVGDNADIYALTTGINYRPHANILVRPEVRWDWIENNTANQINGRSVIEDGGDRQTTFGIDTIFLF